MYPDPLNVLLSGPDSARLIKEFTGTLSEEHLDEIEIEWKSAGSDTLDSPDQVAEVAVVILPILIPAFTAWLRRKAEAEKERLRIHALLTAEDSHTRESLLELFNGFRTVTVESGQEGEGQGPDTQGTEPSQDE